MMKGFILVISRLLQAGFGQAKPWRQSIMMMVRTAVPVAIALLTVLNTASAGRSYTDGWVNGAATFYGRGPWALHTGDLICACHAHATCARGFIVAYFDGSADWSWLGRLEFAYNTLVTR